MIKFFILFILEFYNLNLSSQSCYNPYEDALYLHTFPEYENLTDSILDLEIRNKTQNFHVYLLKAKLCYLHKKNDEGLENLKQSIRFGCDIDHHIFTNKFFRNIVGSSDSLELIHSRHKLIEIPNKTADPVALPELYQLVHWDQALRNFTSRYHDSMCLDKNKAF